MLSPFHGLRAPKVRPALQEIMKSAAAKMKAQLPSKDVACLVEELASQLQNELAQRTSAGEKSVSLWFTQQSAAHCVTWLNVNDPSLPAVNDHPAFAAILKSCVTRLCTCETEGGAMCSVHGAKSVALSDLTWMVADAIFEHVAPSVPHLSMAVLLKCTSGPDSAAAVAAMPSWCHFLGRSEEQQVTQDTGLR